MDETQQPSTVVSDTEPLAFGAVPWRPHHVTLGFTPLVAIAGLALSPMARLLPLLAWVLLVVFAEVWMFAYPLALAWWYGWRPRFSIRLTHVIAESIIAILVVGGLWALTALGYVVWAALAGEPPQSVNPLENTARSGNSLAFILLTVLGIGVAPVTEEVFFRGMLYRALRHSTIRVLAVLIQATTFGILHAAYGPVHVVVTAVMGVALALVYDLRKTLLTPILCHVLHNAAVFVLVVLSVGWALNPPVLGINGTPHENGMLVTDVTPGSGAEAAGIRAGDVISSVGGWSVRDTRHVRDALGGRKPGESVPVEYIRDRVSCRVDVLLRGRREFNR